MTEYGRYVSGNKQAREQASCGDSKLKSSKGKTAPESTYLLLSNTNRTVHTLSRAENGVGGGGGGGGSL